MRYQIEKQVLKKRKFLCITVTHKALLFSALSVTLVFVTIITKAIGRVG